MPSGMGLWKAFLPEIKPVPPARLLMTAVLAASWKSLSPDAPPNLSRTRLYSHNHLKVERYGLKAYHLLGVIEWPADGDGGIKNENVHCHLRFCLSDHGLRCTCG